MTAAAAQPALALRHIPHQTDFDVLYVSWSAAYNFQADHPGKTDPVGPQYWANYCKVVFKTWRTPEQINALVRELNELLEKTAPVHCINAPSGGREIMLAFPVQNGFGFDQQAQEVQKAVKLILNPSQV